MSKLYKKLLTSKEGEEQKCIWVSLFYNEKILRSIWLHMPLYYTNLSSLLLGICNIAVAYLMPYHVYDFVAMVTPNTLHSSTCIPPTSLPVLVHNSIHCLLHPFSTIKFR